MSRHLSIWFDPARGERVNDYREALKAQISSLTDAGLPRKPWRPPQDAFTFCDFPPNFYAAATEKVMTLLTGGGLALLGTWIRARAGRRIRVKFDDVEIEATSIAEVRSLLKAIVKKTKKSRKQ